MALYGMPRGESSRGQGVSFKGRKHPSVEGGKDVEGNWEDVGKKS